MNNKIVTLLLASSIACANSFSLDMDENSVVFKGNVDKRHFSIEAKSDPSIRDDFFQLDLNTSDVVMDTRLEVKNNVPAFISEDVLFDNFQQRISYASSEEQAIADATVPIDNNIGAPFVVIFSKTDGALQFYAPGAGNVRSLLGELEQTSRGISFSARGTASALKNIYDQVFYSKLTEQYPVLAVKGCSEVSLMNGLVCEGEDENEITCTIEGGFNYRITTECE